MTTRPVQLLAAASVAVAGIVGLSALPEAASATVRSRPATSASSAPSRASLTDLVCQHALAPANRSFSDTAVIRTVPGTSREAVRFRLLRRPAKTTDWTAVHGPGLGTWLSKDFGHHPGDVWRVIHTVSDLSAPAAYRFLVSFRWIGSKGATLARSSRVSHNCFQPELRPDLEVRSIAVLSDSAQPSEDIYRARILDAGRTGAGPFQVQLSDQGQVVNRRVARIRPRQTLAVKLVGPACDSSEPPTVTVDPDHEVDVSSRAHATLSATCPAAT